MSEIERVEAEISALEYKIGPLLAEKGKAISKLRELKSREFIRVNSITMDDVERSNTPSVWHGTYCEFGRWMKVQGVKKRFCEWNGCLYPTIDAMNGRMDYKTTALFEHVPSVKEGA